MDDFTTLIGPCGNDGYMHQFRVEVFNRLAEDAPEGLHFDIAERNINVGKSMKTNPSSRRDGLRVYFECEYCPHTHILTIAQHKGMTLLNWEQ